MKFGPGLAIVLIEHSCEAKATKQHTESSLCVPIYGVSLLVFMLKFKRSKLDALGVSVIKPGAGYAMSDLL